MTHDPSIEVLEQIATYLLEEADFNESWVDGRRGRQQDVSPEYAAKRLEIANQRKELAAAAIAIRGNLQSLQARVEGLREALEPFVKIADEIEATASKAACDHGNVVGPARWADCRRAREAYRAALSPTPIKGSDEQGKYKLTDEFRFEDMANALDGTQVSEADIQQLRERAIRARSTEPTTQEVDGAVVEEPRKIAIPADWCLRMARLEDGAEISAGTLAIDPEPPTQLDRPSPSGFGEEEVEAEHAFGRVVWASSDDGGGPDVGISIGLGDGRILWCGEITKQRHEQAGEEAAALGDDFGTWIILYGKENDTHVVGRCCNRDVGQLLIDTLSAAIVEHGKGPHLRAQRKASDVGEAGL